MSKESEKCEMTTEELDLVSGGLGWNIGANPDRPKPATTGSMAVHTGTTGGAVATHFGWDLGHNRGA
jgi:hypothetical protein